MMMSESGLSRDEVEDDGGALRRGDNDTYRYGANLVSAAGAPPAGAARR